MMNGTGFKSYFVNRRAQLLLAACLATVVFFSCNNSGEATQGAAISSDPKIAGLKLPAGFHADHLYGPSENGEGSWVSMTFDDKGRMLASDQYGSIYRMTLPAIGDTVTKVKIEKINIPWENGQKVDTVKHKVSIGYAHGLLYAFNSLYVVINHTSDSAFAKGSGLYRIQDTNGDDEFDKVTLIKKLDGEGEHGPHSIILSPDKQSLYIVAGNYTKIPKMDSYRNYPDGKLDDLMTLIKDPNGHDGTVNWHGGWIAHLDSTGSHWELIASGFRNPFDIAFNDAGDLFTFDSDMEWDFGLPWYRPIRICHVPSGAEFGWRPGNDKWSPTYPDNLPAILNIGQGSPTNVMYGGNAHFPEKYRRSIFTFDWSFGIIYSIHLEPKGASYEAKGEEFVSGSPLPLTDGAIGPDGAMYFMTGGRRLESDVYRVYYDDNKKDTEALPAPVLTDAQKLRRQLEAYQDTLKPGAVDFAWPYLNNEDRFIRYAARIAIEHQPATQWEQKALAEKDPVALTEAVIALARKGSPADKNKYLTALTGIDYSKLTEAQQIDLVRAFELVMARDGMPDAATKTAVIAYLDPKYPANTNNELNRELVKVLAYLEAPDVVSKTVAMLSTAKDDNSAGQQTFTNSSDLIMRNPQYGLDIAGTLAKTPPGQQTFYAVALSTVKTGWTPELQDAYFKWFYHAFSYRGGHSFVGFIDLARKQALANVPKDKFKYFNDLSGDSIVALSGTDLAKGAIQPKGPWREWKLDSAVKMADSGITHRDFDKGKGYFAASLCIQCHTMAGEGGTAGPDLTQLGTRFSYHDMLEAIIDPSKTISDQYGATIFYLNDGGTIQGRLISQDADKYTISQNPFAPLITRDIAKKDVSHTKLSPISPMLPGLINRLNPEELKDLLAYLKAGGNAKDTIFVKK